MPHRCVQVTSKTVTTYVDVKTQYLDVYCLLNSKYQPKLQLLCLPLVNISETNFEVGLIFYQIMATMFKVHNSLVTQLLSFGQLLCFEITGQTSG